MSTTKKVLIIVGSVMLVCLIAAGIIIGTSYSRIGGHGWFGFFSSQSKEIDESASLDLSGVDTINVECVSGNINIAPGEPGAKLTGSILTSSPKESYLSVEKNGSTLTVKFDTDIIFPQTISADVTLSVGLPADVMSNLNVSGASANTDLNGLSLKDVEIDSASGAIHLSGCKGDSLKIDVASGSINVTSADFAGVSASCISGNVEIEDVTGAVTVSSTSGTIRVTDALGEVSVNNISGTVFVAQNQQELKAIHVGVTSGGVEVKLNPDAAFDLNVNSTSGGFHTDYDVTVSGSLAKKIVGEKVSGEVNGGGALVDLSTVSGGISLSKISE